MQNTTTIQLALNLNLVVLCSINLLFCRGREVSWSVVAPNIMPTKWHVTSQTLEDRSWERKAGTLQPNIGSYLLPLDTPGHPVHVQHDNATQHIVTQPVLSDALLEPNVPAAVALSPEVPLVLPANATPIEHLSHWMRVVTDNNLLQQPGLQAASLPVQTIPAPTPGHHLGVAPKHPPHPYSGNQSNHVQISRDHISRAMSILDVTNAEPLFYVAPNGTLLCRCCVTHPGFNVPPHATTFSERGTYRSVLLELWHYFKKSLRIHLHLPSHARNSMAYYQRQGLPPASTLADTEARLGKMGRVGSKLFYPFRKSYIHVSSINKSEAALCPLEFCESIC